MASILVKRYRQIPQNLKPQVSKLLQRCDDDFLPPLSERVNYETIKTAAPSNRYFDEAVEQNAILAFNYGRLVGLMLFTDKDSYTPPEGVDVDFKTYVSTTLVDPEYRGFGIAAAMNELLESADDVFPILRRTWTTNAVNRSLLANRGFKVVKEFPNDRGNDVGTVYYWRES